MPAKKSPVHPYARIWNTVGRIPRGKVASYGSVAAVSGYPGQPRLAGYALHNLPPGADIPWHRVINARGKISLAGRVGSLQRQLLETEGIAFLNGKVDMTRSGWHPSRGRRKK